MAADTAPHMSTQRLLATSQRGVGGMLGISLAVHTLALLAVIVIAEYAPHLQPPPQQAIMTKLVRLGTPRDKNLLPRLPTPQPPAPPPEPKAAPAPAAATPPAPPVPAPAAVPLPGRTAPKPAAPSARQRARALSKVNRALDRLKERLDGQKDGARDGDSDVAVLGNAYATQVSQCLQRNYVIQGYDATRVVGLQATVVVKIAADGRFLSHQITHGSGVAAFDQAVGRAVLRCGKVAPPPPELSRALLSSGIEILFRP